ncbi:MAG: tRNA (adenosine(37)-N6)-threonylcarbamoyltransferase complex ATPase subunit type 1 TsaE [Melioribacteraceae bacterium]|nr:tRNA (adenosine(37)-N6)-threonylcarbamoyltransferase complex ATPase subunit type 1 TsaE [Melioribacteraceae bacterium]MCF8263632.1 tRNA (adenosine(37)-N6)-threonylcarbamoyltransferase complex ATPase subunit type 1 TsaE [Melioribacteraceae bacterium]MCF8412061.1 tRNA (adenosine(37)-N6)-threonylcarbamoyltransferase complex ATPase subunit type 1 TsaE [Melioribacteraceae bacterium]MCF8431886.1 tRNA (adenosine(37)-N6)-threonylcarbamoyltransferase complex ATPase subunit type 1 TsaE [Melioribacterac
MKSIFVPGVVVSLIGNLGSGKTFFVKEFASAFGIKDVDSPTFTIVNEYVSNQKIIHIDFYRINKISELYEIGIFDYLNNPETIVFVEWGNLYPDILPEKRFELEIESSENNHRKICVYELG